MDYDIETVRMAPQLLAAVRARVSLDGIAQSFRAPLDLVWAFLGAKPGLRTDGRNVFLYHHATMEGRMMDVDFGVQVVRRFEAEGDVRCIETPSGEAVTTLHRGPYGGLRAAHMAIYRHLGERKRPFSMEIYGDWSDDPSKLETTVVYLLA